MKLEKFFDDFVNEKLMNTHVSFIAKITGNVTGASAVSSGKMCDIQPLFMYKEIGKEEKTSSIITKVPISQSVRKIEYYEHKIKDHDVEHPSGDNTTEEHECEGTLTKSNESTETKVSNIYGGHIKIVPFSAGDIVVCLCCDRNIDEVRKGKLSLPSSASVHEISNCVIVGYLL